MCFTLCFPNFDFENYRLTKKLIHQPSVDYEFFMGNNDESEEDGPQIVELVEESEVKTEAQNE